MAGSRSYLIVALNDRERTIAGWRNREGTDWVDQMLLGGMLTCAEHGYRLMVELIDTHSDHIARELLGAIAALQPDGVILTPPHSENPLITQLLEAQGISFARIGSRQPGSGFAVAMDEDGAARLATEHLIGLGHERIGFIAGPDDYALSGWRVDGWRQAMADARLSTENLLAQGDFGFASGRAAATFCWTARPRPPRSSRAATRWRSPRWNWRASAASTFPPTCRSSASTTRRSSASSTRRSPRSSSRSPRSPPTPSSASSPTRRVANLDRTAYRPATLAIRASTGAPR